MKKLNLLLLALLSWPAPLLSQNTTEPPIELIEVSRVRLPVDFEVIGARVDSGRVIMWSSKPGKVIVIDGSDLRVYVPLVAERILSAGLIGGKLAVAHTRGIDVLDDNGHWQRPCDFGEVQARAAAIVSGAWFLWSAVSAPLASQCHNWKTYPKILNDPIHVVSFSDGFAATELKYPFRSLIHHQGRAITLEPLSSLADLHEDTANARETWVSLPILDLGDNEALQTLADLKGDTRRVVLFREGAPARIVNISLPIGFIASDPSCKSLYGLLFDSQLTLIAYRRHNSNFKGAHDKAPLPPYCASDTVLRRNRTAND